MVPFQDIAHPLNQKTRDQIEEAVFTAYQKEVQIMGASLEILKTKKEATIPKTTS